MSGQIADRPSAVEQFDAPDDLRRGDQVHAARQKKPALRSLPRPIPAPASALQSPTRPHPRKGSPARPFCRRRRAAPRAPSSSRRARSSAARRSCGRAGVAFLLYPGRWQRHEHSVRHSRGRQEDESVGLTVFVGDVGVSRRKPQTLIVTRSAHITHEMHVRANVGTPADAKWKVRAFGGRQPVRIVSPLDSGGVSLLDSGGESLLNSGGSVGMKRGGVVKPSRKRVRRESLAH